MFCGGVLFLQIDNIYYGGNQRFELLGFTPNIWKQSI